MAGVLASFPAFGEEMKAEEARHFVVGKLFSFNCFEGTRGAGRIFPDGSVAGSIQFRGQGPVRFASLPANTLRVKGESVCASLRGMPIEPCFNLNKTDQKSFRGSVWGLSFAYCDFTRQGQVHVASSGRPAPLHRPLSLRGTTASVAGDTKN
jgi:hypothetical protein